MMFHLEGVLGKNIGFHWTGIVTLKGEIVYSEMEGEFFCLGMLVFNLIVNLTHLTQKV